MCFHQNRPSNAWQPRPGLRARPVVMPRHTVGRHAHRAVATGCRSLGSAWPTVSRSGRRIASAMRSRGGNRGTLGGIGETPPGASGVRPPPGAPRTVAVVARRPWCPFRLAGCALRRVHASSASAFAQCMALEGAPFNASPAAVVSTILARLAYFFISTSSPSAHARATV
jgi:hypothetical protein